MAEHVIIDGNNLLHAMHAHAPLPTVGRETLFKIIDRWARRGDDRVTLVFDGPVPHGGLAKQLASSRIDVRFSAPQTADDVIVGMVHRATDPGTIRVVTSDRAIQHEASYRRCRHVDAAAFVAELFPRQGSPKSAPTAPREKPPDVTPEEKREWLDAFGYDDTDDEPFDGFDAMVP